LGVLLVYKKFCSEKISIIVYNNTNFNEVLKEETLYKSCLKIIIKDFNWPAKIFNNDFKLKR
jgi:hypothetical protein